jgi:murein peptide amidase A
VLLPLLVLVACSGEEATPPPSTLVTTTVVTTTAVSTSTTSTSTTPTTASTTPTTSTSTSTSTTVPAATGRTVEIGRSVQGRPITAVERGMPGGTPVVVIGVIHGDEQAGTSIVDRLATLPVPPGVDLWLVTSMNPDGQAVPQRGNARGVDLNRNFPDGWGPIGSPGDGQYAGTGPASEPETRAIVGLVDQLQPRLTIFYHQDLNRLSPSSGFEGTLKERYAALTGLPIERITGGTYTGVAATWVRHTTGHPAFIVELGPILDPEQADTHAAAVLDIAAMAAAGG